MLMKNKSHTKEKKETRETIEQERNMLKITLEYMAKENENMKRQNEDMKVTVRSNKELLREYIEKITNKDKVVEKMNNTIELLQSRLQSLEEYIKNQQNQNYTGSKTGRSMTPMRNNHNGIENSNSANKLSSEYDNITGENGNQEPETSDVTRAHNSFRNNFNLKPIRPPKNDKVITNRAVQDNNYKEFLSKQNNLMEELTSLRNELITFLSKQTANTTCSKNLDNSHSSPNISLSCYSDKININLKDKYTTKCEDLGPFESLIKHYDEDNKDVLLFVDSEKSIWELIKRNDLTIDILNTNEVKSINKIISDLNLNMYVRDSILLNINKEGDFESISISDSELDISKGSDLNDVSNLVRETLNNNNVSELY